MTQRPKPQITLAPADKIIEIAGWAALILLWFITVSAYASLPETIPTHFNAAGQADDHGSKMMILFIPAIGTLLFAGLTVLNFYPQVFNYPTAITAENAQRQYANATRMIRTLRLSIAITFAVLVYLIHRAALTQHDSLGPWFLPVMLAIILGPLAYFTIRTIKIK
jgi:uncharacterized membrane protein